MVIRNILPIKHRKGHNKMKKAIMIVTILILVTGIFLYANKDLLKLSNILEDIDNSLSYYLIKQF